MKTANFSEYITEEQVLNFMGTCKSLIYVTENKQFKTIEELEKYLHDVPSLYHPEYKVAERALSQVKHTLLKYQNAREIFKVSENKLLTDHIEECFFKLSFGFSIKAKRKCLSLFSAPVTDISVNLEEPIEDFKIIATFVISGVEIDYDVLTLSSNDSFFKNKGFTGYSVPIYYRIKYFLSKQAATNCVRECLRDELKELKEKQYSLENKLNQIVMQKKDVEDALLKLECSTSEPQLILE